LSSPLGPISISNFTIHTQAIIQATTASSLPTAAPLPHNLIHHHGALCQVHKSQTNSSHHNQQIHITITALPHRSSRRREHPRQPQASCSCTVKNPSSVHAILFKLLPCNKTEQNGKEEKLKREQKKRRRAAAREEKESTTRDEERTKKKWREEKR
jgi:hypothetical protein